APGRLGPVAVPGLDQRNERGAAPAAPHEDRGPPAGHAGHAPQDGLEVLGEDVAAADLDRVAEAPDDVQRALVDEPRVAREQGPVADRAGAAGLAALVPVGHGLAADDDLAEVPLGELLPVRAGDRDRDSLDRLPAARQPAGRAVE